MTEVNAEYSFQYVSLGFVENKDKHILKLFLWPLYTIVQV